MGTGSLPTHWTRGPGFGTDSQAARPETSEADASNLPYPSRAWAHNSFPWTAAGLRCSLNLYLTKPRNVYIMEHEVCAQRGKGTAHVTTRRF
jgi:hypothetical protein